jgi:hypothetical protein
MTAWIAHGRKSFWELRNLQNEISTWVNPEKDRPPELEVPDLALRGAKDAVRILWTCTYTYMSTHYGTTI